jgi:hypothetical protein
VYKCISRQAVKKWFGSEKEKEKENIFFFSVFPSDQGHAPNYPVLNVCMPLTIKSMIGGCRTLLVMNSVNPLLRYLSHVLSHVTASIEHPHSMLDNDKYKQEDEGFWTTFFQQIFFKKIMVTKT